MYDSSVKLLVKRSETLSSMKSTIGIDGTTDTVSTDEDYETEIELSKLRPLIEELIDALQIFGSKDELIEYKKLLKAGMGSNLLHRPSIKIEQSEDADILEVTARSADPAQAADMANKLAELYIQDSLDRTKEEFKAARLYLENQLEKIATEYHQALLDMRDFMIDEGTVDLDTEIENLLDRINALQQEYETTGNDILSLEKSSREIRAKLAKQEKYRKETEEFTQNTLLQELKTKLADLLVEASSASTNIKKTHPTYIQRQSEIDQVRELIKKETEVVFDTSRFSVDPVYDNLMENLVENDLDIVLYKEKQRITQSYLDEYKQKLLKIPYKRITNSKLDLLLTVKQELYRQLLEYMIQVGMAESMTLSDIRLVESAVPAKKKVFPKKALNYFLGLFLGTICGLGMALFIEHIDNGIREPEDLKPYPDLTHLGVVPYSKELQANTLISDLDPVSPTVEAFRTVKNRIKSAVAKNPLKTIVVSSPVEAEGKTSVAANLAIALAMEGKKVVLVSLDLRLPGLNLLFGKPAAAPGLTTILNGDAIIKNTVTATPVKGLNLLLEGPVPKDPIRLLESERLKPLLDELGATHDYIIIDTPPLLIMNDALIAGTHADGMLLVVEAGKTTHPVLEQAIETAGGRGIPLMGAVLNKYRTNDPRPYYRNYYDKYYDK